MNNAILLYGRGLAAVVSAWLLAKKGKRVIMIGEKSQISPFVMVNQPTVHLLKELFQAQIFTGKDFYHVSSKVVKWDNLLPTQSPEPGFICQASSIVNRLEHLLFSEYNHYVSISERYEGIEPERNSYDWTIYAAGKNYWNIASNRLSFGRRKVLYAVVKCSPKQPLVLKVEATTRGILVYFPTDMQGSGILLCTIIGSTEDMDKQLNELLRSSTLIAPSIGEISAIQSIEAAPSLSQPVIGKDWINVGEAAMSFDPICGDGTGVAIRSSILATALINNKTPTADFISLGRHYQSRLYRSLRSHLKACEHYYSSIALSPAWIDEKMTMANSVKYLESCLAVTDKTHHFVLHKTDLIKAD